MSPDKLGSLIGGVFGLMFVELNSGVLPSPLALTLRVLAGVAFLGVLLAAGRPDGGTSSGPPGAGLPRAYWFVVVAEALVMLTGLVVLNGPLETPQAAVAWISFVVGMHFFALAIIGRSALFHGLGASLSACGATALVLAAKDAREVSIDLVGGVLPGALLLGFGLWGSTRPVDRRDRL